jgi:hypothetical protein
MREELTISITISNLQKNSSPEQWQHHIRYQMSHGLAEKIYDAKLASMEDTNQFSTTYRMNIIVADVDDYWADVERKAYEISSTCRIPTLGAKQ